MALNVKQRSGLLGKTMMEVFGFAFGFALC